MFHERRTGEAASVFVDEGHLLLRLTCRAAGNLTDHVPYALAISVDVGVETGIPGLASDSSDQSVRRGFAQSQIQL